MPDLLPVQLVYPPPLTAADKVLGYTAAVRLTVLR